MSSFRIPLLLLLFTLAAGFASAQTKRVPRVRIREAPDVTVVSSDNAPVDLTETTEAVNAPPRQKGAAAKATVAASSKPSTGSAFFEESEPGVFRFDPSEDCLGGWNYDTEMAWHQEALDGAAGLRFERNYLEQWDELVLSAKFPKPVGIIRSVCEDGAAWGAGRIFAAWVFVPSNAGAHPSIQMVARHPVWGWFINEPTRPLLPGKWTRVYWTLDQESPGWRSLESMVEWNDTIRMNLDQVGLRIYSNAASTCDIRVADMRIEGVDRPLPKLEALNVKSRTARPSRGKRFELGFDLSRSYANPFDPDMVSVDVDFFWHGPAEDARDNGGRQQSVSERPARKTISMPAFYFQDFLRSRLPHGGEELCLPRGKAFWMARFTPREAGVHSFVIRAKDVHGDETKTAPVFFTVEDAPFKGYIRVDPNDPRYLSFENGDFFYPVGMVVRSPGDTRVLYPYEFEPPQTEGTYSYDTYFGGMAKSGMNFARVWMSSWWTALEWSKGYRKDFQGLGQYSLMNAWRQDYVIDLAEQMGIYLDLTLHNHGQLSVRVDTEWSDNPHNVRQGGPLENAPDYWSNETAKKHVKKRLRYVVGRWGHSPAIAWFVLFNEVNLVEGYNSEQIGAWHKEMATYLKEINPYQHLVSTHVTNGNFDSSVGGLEEIDIKQSNGYNSNQIESSLRLLSQMGGYNLPAYINEFGTASNRLTLRHNLHSGLWVSTVLPFLGPSLYWYWPHVHYSDEYYQYEALLAFNKGEDYRGLGMSKTDSARTNKGELGVLGQQSQTNAYLWIYERQIYERDKSRENLEPDEKFATHKDVELTVDNLMPGVYRIEFWDTWRNRNRPVSIVEHRHEEGDLKVAVPAFERDLACKVKQVLADYNGLDERIPERPE
jgi:hypothetical protein